MKTKNTFKLIYRSENYNKTEAMVFNEKRKLLNHGEL